MEVEGIREALEEVREQLEREGGGRESLGLVVEEVQEGPGEMLKRSCREVFSQRR